MHKQQKCREYCAYCTNL